MINKVEYKDCPELFDNLLVDYDPIKTIRNHRRGSSFYCEDIIEIGEDDLEYFPTLPKEYYGFWKTNTYMWDDNYGKEDGVSELTRVEKVETKTYKWIEVK